MRTLGKGSDPGLRVAESRQTSTLLSGSSEISAGGPGPGAGFNLDRVWHIQGLAPQERVSLSSWVRVSGRRAWSVELETAESLSLQENGLRLKLRSTRAGFGTV